jgi:hypothetical protein
MNLRTSGTIMVAALATALAAAAPATAAPRGQWSGVHASGGSGARVSIGGGRNFSAAGMNRGGVTVNQGAGPSAGFAATSRSNFAGSNFASNRSGNWSGNNNWRGRHHRGYGGFGAGFAAGALIGSAPYYYGDYGYDDYAYADGYDDDSYVAAPVYAGDDDAASCAQRFRSYDPRSGTYLGYDGLRHPCP